MNKITQTMLFRQSLINYVECVQTDNGFEFTKRFGGDKNGPALFEQALARHGIRHKLIKPFTPRHNGKVERSHRKDNDYFYATHRFYPFEDFKTQRCPLPQIQCLSYASFGMEISQTIPSGCYTQFVTHH